MKSKIGVTNYNPFFSEFIKRERKNKTGLNALKLEMKIVLAIAVYIFGVAEVSLISHAYFATM